MFQIKTTLSSKSEHDLAISSKSESLGLSYKNKQTLSGLNWVFFLGGRGAFAPPPPLGILLYIYCNVQACSACPPGAETAILPPLSKILNAALSTYKIVKPQSVFYLEKLGWGGGEGEQDVHAHIFRSHPLLLSLLYVYHN